jgi:hypothetical protein
MTIKRRSPVEITPEIAIEICRRMSEGQSLKEICRDESMPCCSTIYRVLRDDESFLRIYVAAQTDLAHSHFQ